MIESELDHISGLATLSREPTGIPTLMAVQAPGCRSKMENYFREKKRVWRRSKRSEDSGILARTIGTSQSPVEQDEDDHVNPENDKLLRTRGRKDASRRTYEYWRPESPYILGGYEEYVPVKQMVVAAPSAAVQNEEGGWSLQFSPLENLCRTSLKALVRGYPLEGVLFTVTQSPQEGEGKLQLDFPAVMDYMRNFLETGIHLQEVVQDKTRATTRFIVGSWMDPRMPDLPFYTPRAHGGPFFRDRDGNYSIPRTVKSYRSAQRLPHDLEFFFSLSKEQKTHLEEMCNQVCDPQ